VNFFENYAIVAMESDNVTYYQCKIIKVTSGFNLKKTNFFARWRQHLQNSWNIFQIQITSLFRCSQGPQGCLEKQNYPVSLNLVVWRAKIGPKTSHTQNQETSKNLSKYHHVWHFFGQFWGFSNFLGFGPNFSAPIHQIPTQWMISLL
jgi:hypothetical protein